MADAGKSTEAGNGGVKESLYVSYIEEPDGTLRPVGYAYGAPWVYQALLMDDMRFDTPEEAKAWWEENYGGGNP